MHLQDRKDGEGAPILPTKRTLTLDLNVLNEAESLPVKSEMVLAINRANNERAPPKPGIQ